MSFASLVQHHQGMTVIIALKTDTSRITAGPRTSKTGALMLLQLDALAVLRTLGSFFQLLKQVHQLDFSSVWRCCRNKQLGCAPYFDCDNGLETWVGDPAGEPCPRDSTFIYLHNLHLRHETAHVLPYENYSIEQAPAI